MKVLFLARSDIFKVSGGDTSQINETAKELGKLGVEVVVSNTSKIDINPFDVVHIFQLDWIPETYFYIKKAKELGKKIVLSPIHHAERDVKRFDDMYAFGLRKFVGFFVKKQEYRDILKNLYRAVFFDRSKFGPTVKGLILGYRNTQARCLALSDMVLVQTNKEAEDLERTYNIKFPWKQISNGVPEDYLTKTSYKKVFDFDNYLICVGRIEARKNQLSVIEAVKLLRKESGFENTHLVFLGRKSLNHRTYVKKFEKEISENDWIHHPGFVPFEEMMDAQHWAKVGVSASWFETTGLTIIEALFCGVNAVATGERAREILGDLVEYCDPGDVLSIKEAIIKAWKRPKPVLPESFYSEYSWSSVAKKTLEVYRSI